MSHLDELNRWNPAEGKLPEHLAQALDTDPELRAAFDARFPPMDLDLDLSMPPGLAGRITPVRAPRWGRRVVGVALTTAALAAAGLVAVGLWGAPDHPDHPDRPDRPDRPGAPVDPPISQGELAPDHYDGAYGIPQPFPRDLGDGSYRGVQRMLSRGILPSAPGVAPISFLDALPNADPAPVGVPFAFTSEAAASPWARGGMLVRIALRGADGPPPGEQDRLARDVDAQIAWCPQVVHHVRLIGTGEVPAVIDAPTMYEMKYGHRSMAVYEVQLVPGATGSLGSFWLRHHGPQGGLPVQETWSIAPTRASTWSRASHDLQLAVALASFAEKLRGGSALEWSEIVRLTRQVARPDDAGEAELLGMVETAARLAAP